MSSIQNNKSHAEVLDEEVACRSNRINIFETVNFSKPKTHKKSNTRFPKVDRNVFT